MKMLRSLDRVINFIIMVTFVTFTLYGAYSLYDAILVYKSASDIQGLVLPYKPDIETYDGDDLLEGIRELNGDTYGWISMEGTKIDHPVVQGKDNFEYLNKDINGDFSIPGSIYLDHRNSNDFSDNYSMIYGHKMSNSGMFGDLDLFENEEFFESNRFGELITRDKVYGLKTVAFLKGSAYDSDLFQIDKSYDTSEKYKYFKNNSMYYIEPDNLNNRIMVLSTCASYKSDVRYLLVVQMVESD